MKKEQHGFGHIILIVLILVVLSAVGFAVYKVSSQNKDASSDNKTSGQRNDDGSQNSQKQPDPDEKLELYNFGIKDLDSLGYVDHVIQDYDGNGKKGFYIFGDSLGKNDPRKNPNFEFAFLKKTDEVISSMNGTVAFIKEQETPGDFEVFLQPSENSMWVVGYDHVTNLHVKKGDNIKAGDLIGNPVVQGNGFARFEIQINKELNGETTHYCPSSFLHSSVKDSILASFKKLQEKWETGSGLDLYKIDKQSPTGCYVEAMSPATAQGQ